MAEKGDTMHKQIVVGVVVAVLSTVILAWLGLGGGGGQRDRPSRGSSTPTSEPSAPATGQDSSHISGWTTIFEENQVLRGPGGTLGLYPSEMVPGFQVFVIIPKDRVVKSESLKDGDGNEFLAVTVAPS